MNGEKITILTRSPYATVQIGKVGELQLAAKQNESFFRLALVYSDLAALCVASSSGHSTEEEEEGIV